MYLKFLVYYTKSTVSYAPSKYTTNLRKSFFNRIKLLKKFFYQPKQNVYKTIFQSVYNITGMSTWILTINLSGVCSLWSARRKMWKVCNGTIEQHCWFVYLNMLQFLWWSKSNNCICSKNTFLKKKKKNLNLKILNLKISGWLHATLKDWTQAEVWI